MVNKKIYPIEDLSEDNQKLFDVLNESNDLACVLIGVSFLDEVLRSILLRHFVKCETAKNLLNLKGALGSFGSRCDLAYCLGLIKKKTYKDLRIISEIRNLFAHSHLLKSFKDKDIINLTDSLSTCDILKGTIMFYKADDPTKNKIYENSLGRFKLTIVLLSQALLVIGISVKKLKENQIKNKDEKQKDII